MKVINLNLQEQEWKYKSPDCHGGILQDGTFVYDMKCAECKRQYQNRKNKWIEIVKKFIGYQVSFFRMCDGCKQLREIDEGRMTYDKWYCSECGGRMGFNI